MHPATEATRLSDKDLRRLFRATRYVLEKAIALKTDFDRLPKSWLLTHRGKAGQMSALRPHVEISNDRRTHFMVLRALPDALVTQASSLTRPADILPAEGPLAGRKACATEQPGWLCYAATGSSQHFEQRNGVFRRGAFGIIVEVDVHVPVFVEPAADPRRPSRKRGLTVARCVFPGVPV